MSKKEARYFARISEADYPAFRSLLKEDLPTDFGDWQKLRSAWVKEYAAYTIFDQSVDPARFKKFCDAKGCALTLIHLLEFAEAVSKDRV